MNVLVTGAGGLVGHAVQETAPSKISVTYVSSADGDLRNFEECDTIFCNTNPTHVIHLAARVGGVLDNSTHNADFFRDNILINSNVLECAYWYKTEKVVSLLSSCIYPSNCSCPLRAEDLHLGEPHYTNYGYAYAKRMLEVQSRSYNEQYKTNFVCLIPNNIYGPNDNFDLLSSHVVPGLIRKIHDAKMNDSSPILWGDGSSLRELTFSIDIGKMLWWSLEKYQGPALNIGTDEEVSIKDLVSTICLELDYEVDKIEWDTTKPNGQFRKPTDKTLFNSLYNKSCTLLKDGIKQTLMWYKKQYPNIRGTCEKP